MVGCSVGDQVVFVGDMLGVPVGDLLGAGGVGDLVQLSIAASHSLVGPCVGAGVGARRRPVTVRRPVAVRRPGAATGPVKNSGEERAGLSMAAAASPAGSRAIAAATIATGSKMFCSTEIANRGSFESDIETYLENNIRVPVPHPLVALNRRLPWDERSSLTARQILSNPTNSNLVIAPSDTPLTTNLAPGGRTCFTVGVKGAMWTVFVRLSYVMQSAESIAHNANGTSAFVQSPA